MLRVGDWCVNPTSGQISRNGKSARLEARTMRLLLSLAEHAGEVVSIDFLLDHAWSGVIVTPDSVYQGIAALRKILGDDPHKPTYIATVPRLGYRMIAPVSPWPEASVTDRAGEGERAQKSSMPAAEGQHLVPPNADSEPAVRRWRARFRWAAGVAICPTLAGLTLFVFHGKLAHTAHATPPEIAQRSVAVLPFLDLTEGMKAEEFADGMTEEMIDKLSKLQGFRVPAPTASFYFKNKRVPIPEIGRTLGVAYVVDGSERKSGDRRRVAARLICADRGYVVWAKIYDRPWSDALTIQDDIACELMRALQASIESGIETGKTP